LQEWSPNASPEQWLLLSRRADGRTHGAWREGCAQACHSPNNRYAPRPRRQLRCRARTSAMRIPEFLAVWPAEQTLTIRSLNLGTA
jgi:hypothetical protein